METSSFSISNSRVYPSESIIESSFLFSGKGTFINGELEDNPRHALLELPAEIRIHILSYLGYMDCLNFCSTCKELYGFKKINDFRIRQIVFHNQHNPKRYNWSVPRLLNALEMFPNLQRIRLCQPRPVMDLDDEEFRKSYDELKLKAKAEDSFWEEWEKRTAELKKKKREKKLKDLEVKQVTMLVSRLSECKHLHILELEDWSLNKKGSSAVTLASLQVLPLKHLALRNVGAGHKRAFFPLNMMEVPNYFTCQLFECLEVLDLSGNNHLNDLNIELVRRVFKNLKEVRLANCEQITGNRMNVWGLDLVSIDMSHTGLSRRFLYNFLMAQPSQLRCLTIAYTGMDSLGSDSHPSQLVERLWPKTLEVLDIRGLMVLSSSMFQRLVKECPLLRKLYISTNPFMTTVDQLQEVVLRAIPDATVCVTGGVEGEHSGSGLVVYVTQEAQENLFEATSPTLEHPS